MKYLAAKYPAALKTLVFSVATAIGGVAAAQTTVQYWDFWVTQGPAIDEIIATFEEQNPDIRIEKNTIGGGPYNESLDLAMQSDSGPDVFVIPEPDGNRENGFLDYINQGYLYTTFRSLKTLRRSGRGFPGPQDKFCRGLEHR